MCWYNPSLKENKRTDVNPTYEVESLLQILEIVEVAEEKVASILIVLIFVENRYIEKIVDILCCDRYIEKSLIYCKL